MDSEAPLRFERRRHDRWPADGVAVACRSAGDRFGQTIALRLIDESEVGLGATCDRPLEPGAVVTVSFQRPGYRPRQGLVVRCLPHGDGYRLAILFERRMAA